MKNAKLILFLLLISNNNFAQCYSKIVSYSRNYIALQTDGTLWSKGTTFNRSLLGFGDNPAPAEFTQIGTDSNWTDNISLNGVNVFAIKTDGTLWVWGSNFPSGSAGLGTYAELGYFTPRQVGTDTNWAKVTAGFGFTIAVKTDGTLWAWGENQRGVLGTGNLDNAYKTNIPIQVGTDNDWAKVFAENSTCAYAIKTDGTLWSWGNEGNYIGYENATTNNNYRSPHQVGNDTWQTLAVNFTGPMADGIKTDGSLWGWGSSSGVRYFFGNGIDTYSSQTPVRIGTDSDWKQVCIGPSTTIALKNNGTRWGWGRNGTGYQLGMGAGMTSNVTVPTQLDVDLDWRRLNIDITGSGYGDGIKENNTLYHWGNTNQNIIYPSPTLFSITNCTLGLDEFEKSSVTVYPNPINDFTNIRVSRNLGALLEVSISNQLGQELLSKKIEIVNQEFTLNLSNYASGVYYLSLRNPEQIFKTKIIKN